jgi:hypothetical protein
MIRRNTWVLIILFAVLLAAVLFSQRLASNAPGGEDQATPTAAPQLLDVQDSAAIQRVKLSDAAGKVVEFGRDASGQWSMLAPAQAIDLAAAEGLVSQLVSLRAVNTLTTPPPPDATGIATPAYTIEVQRLDNRLITLLVGNTTATGNGVYVQVKRGDLYVVNKFSIDAVTAALVTPPLLATATPEVSATAVITTTQTTTPAP